MVRLGWFLIDLSCVVLFAALGRATHGESVLGTFVTAWPFLIGCACAWLVLLLLFDDALGPRPAVIVWLVTLLGGLALRLASGDTAAVPFIIVATLFLAATLLGWRLVARAVRRKGQA